MEGARLAQMKVLGGARAGQTTFPTPRQQQMAETGSPVGPRPPARGRSKIPKLPRMPALQVPKDSQNAVRIVSGELSRAKAELDRLHSAYTELRAFAEKQQVEIIALRKRVAGAPSVCPECNALLPSFLDSPALLTQQDVDGAAPPADAPADAPAARRRNSRFGDGGSRGQRGRNVRRHARAPRLQPPARHRGNSGRLAGKRRHASHVRAGLLPAKKSPRASSEAAADGARARRWRRRRRRRWRRT